MISNKKSNAIKMLQLALALSLLQVDPDNYFYQNFSNWDSQLELRNGDGWELEMLRAVPMVEYPYANHKTMMPLIEDLILFDRMHASNNQHNVTAYLLNVQGDTANQTAAIQELQTPATVASNTVGSPSGASTVSLEHAATAVNAVTGNSSGIGVSDIDLFLNSDHFQDQITIWEQNLADLNDFGELSPPSLGTYAGLPMKDEPLETAYLRYHADSYLPGIAADLNRLEQQGGAGALNDSAPNPPDSCSIKIEHTDGDKDAEENATGLGELIASRPNQRALISKCIKQEQFETMKEKGKEVEVKDEYDDKKDLLDINELGPFLGQVELTEEESEIVEVLWKQDVDLGYTLTPSSLNETDDTSLASATASLTSDGGRFIVGDKQQRALSNIFDDDIEQLKALANLKDDKILKETHLHNDDDLNNEWAGIPFTIDNETGEYIRLPLDDLLNDVLRLADFVDDDTNDEASPDDSIASTSKAAANKVQNNNKNNSITSKTDRNNADTDADLVNETSNNSNPYKTTTQKDDNKSNNNNNNNNNKDIDTTNTEISNVDVVSPEEVTEDEVRSLSSPLFDLDDEAKEELADLDIMIQSAAPPFHHHHHPHHVHHRPGGAPAGAVQNYAAVGSGANSAFHHRQAVAGYPHSHHQGRVPLTRGVSMEQRLQDIASLFNPIPSMSVGVSDMTPYTPHYASHYAYQGGPNPSQHSSQYPPPPPPPPPHPHHHHHHHHLPHHSHHQAMLHANTTLGVDICPSTQTHFGHNLGTAVSSSMHLTNTGHDQDVVVAGGGSAYKMEHEMGMYYTNASSDMNHTTDGFINSILNDEDLHLMDMNVNENFCRLVDLNNSTSNNSSILGLSSGHASASASGAISSSNGLAMNATTGMCGGGVNGGGGGGGLTTTNGIVPPTSMTSDIMNSGVGGGATGATGATGSGGGGGDRLDASSDSAVSSMGSERVPSLSDGEWGEGSDSAQDYHQGKYGGPYDYSYSNHGRLNDGTRQPPVAQKKHQMFGRRFLQEPTNGLDPTNVATNGTAATVAGGADVNAHIQAPPPPIKYEYESSYPPVVGGIPPPGGGSDHVMGGVGGEGAIGPATLLNKEMQAYDLKYANLPVGGGYSLDFSLRPPHTPHDIVQHNHTYTLPQGTGSLPRPQQRDKKFPKTSSASNSKSSKMSSSSSSSSSMSIISGEEEHLTRDEKRARALSIPIAVSDIINLPMDEFNERLSKYDLTENQLSLIRDIRRRGKNKVAAQNCRKRKLDQILSLEDEVKEVRRRKDQLCHDRDTLDIERKRISTKFAALHRHIFQYLRDPDGNPCSPSEYSLQQAADGSIYLLPRDNNKTDAAGGVTTLATTTQPLHGGGGGGGCGTNISNSHNTHVHLGQSNHHHHHLHHHPHIAQAQASNQQQQQHRQQHSRPTQLQQQQQQQHQTLSQHAQAVSHHSSQQNSLQSQQKD